eukprot:TRINITY_DN29578_c0_g2_i3.p1 TRINITY_DN29578_c0_g2~~TRINITY_DN29578_c0_g2_i3.p1  ORF type:complete len:236 (-),score=35.02 TRINITY_DN29578_c0_g2_i3:53-760(-)
MGKDVQPEDYQPNMTLQHVPLIRSPQVTLDRACELFQLTSEDVVCDLGCGHGGFCITAVQRAQVRKAIGIDVCQGNLEQCRVNAAEAGVADICDFVLGDFRDPDFDIPQEVTALYVYLLPWALQLVETLVGRALARGCRAITFQFHDFKALRPSRVGMLGALKLYTGASLASSEPVVSSPHQPESWEQCGEAAEDEDAEEAGSNVTATKLASTEAVTRERNSVGQEGSIDLAAMD